MWHESFLVRLGVLLGLLAALAAWDWRRHGRDARRWREYLFLLGCGVLGAAFGMASDQVTARISPEYFTWGKGVPRGDGFWPGVMGVAVEAGATAGFVLGGTLLLANSLGRSKPPLPVRQLLRYCPWPLIAAATGTLAGFLLGPLAGKFLPIAETADLRQPGRLEALNLVWFMHVGLYLGAATGTGLAALSVRRQRKRRQLAEAKSA